MLYPHHKCYSTGISNFRLVGWKTGISGSRFCLDIWPSRTPFIFENESRSISRYNFCRYAVVYNGLSVGSQCVGNTMPTALANQRPPPSSNQLRCPPREVVQSTPYGVCWISLRGKASSVATCSSQSRAISREDQRTGSSCACIARKGMRMDSRESIEEASR